ncbi:MAG: histidine phosphatase family protein [Propionibacteriaceae bacterium]|nr:histidine phosphatase family protein [Propionibacteriaceae bacterium]
MRLYLVRHGQTASNVQRLLDTAHPGADLDDVGREQASALTERLSGHAIDAIYASDLVRTQQTAAPLASDRGLEVTVLGGLREIQAGEDEMSPHWQRYVDTLQQWADDLSASVPGGEDAHAFYARYDEAIAAIAAAGHRTAALVSHGAALRMWIGARVNGIEAADVAGRRLDNTTVVTIEGDPDDGWTFVAWDEPAPVEPDDAVLPAPGTGVEA